MFLGLAAIGCGHCVQKERSRNEIDNGRAHDAHCIKLSADKIARRHRRANVALPDNAAIESVERIHIVRFSYRNDHCSAARAVFDVKRLCINVAAMAPSKFKSRVRFGRGGW